MTWQHVWKLVFLVTLLCTLHSHALASALTNFQLEKLRIKADKRAPYYGGWMQLRDDAANKFPQRPHDGIRHVLSKIEDPYCRFIEPEIMQDKRDNLRGVSVGIGLRMKRRWNFRHFSRVLKYALYPSITSNNKLDIFIHQAGFACTIAASVFTFLSKAPSAQTAKFVLLPMFVGSVLLRLTPFLRPLEVVETLTEKADQCGIQVGDKLILVNGKPIPIIGSEEAVANLINRGNVGEIVNVTVLREPISILAASSPHPYNNKKKHFAMQPPSEHTFQIERDYCLHETIEARLINRVPGKTTAYVRIREFSDETYSEFSYVWEKLRKEMKHHHENLQVHPTIENVDLIASASPQNAQISKPLNQQSVAINKVADSDKSTSKIGGLILDLRGNSGGALVPALDIASMFLPHGTIVTCLASNLSPPTKCPKDYKIFTTKVDNDNNINKNNNSKPPHLDKFISTNRNADKETAILVLADDLTASASEILVEALCDNQRAISAAPISRAPQEYGIIDGEYVPIPSLPDISDKTAVSNKLRFPEKDYQKLKYPGVFSSLIHLLPRNGGAPQRTVGKNLAQAVLSLSDESGLFFSVREFFAPSGRSMSGGHVPDCTLRALGVIDDTEGVLKRWFQRHPTASIDSLCFDAEKDIWRLDL